MFAAMAFATSALYALAPRGYRYDWPAGMVAPADILAGKPAPMRRGKGPARTKPAKRDRRRASVKSSKRRIRAMRKGAA